MCTGCMDFSNLVHDTNFAVDPLISEPVINALQRAALKRDKKRLTKEELGLILCVMGADFLLWEDK